MFRGIKFCKKIHIIIFQDSVESGYEVQDDETTTKFLVTYNIVHDITIQNKTPPWLLNVILDISGTATTTTSSSSWPVSVSQWCAHSMEMVFHNLYRG